MIFHCENNLKHTNQTNCQNVFLQWQGKQGILIYWNSVSLVQYVEPPVWFTCSSVFGKDTEAWWIHWSVSVCVKVTTCLEVWGLSLKVSECTAKSSKTLYKCRACFSFFLLGCCRDSDGLPSDSQHFFYCSIRSPVFFPQYMSSSILLCTCSMQGYENLMSISVSYTVLFYSTWALK